jgi:hypothetical protein
MSNPTFLSRARTTRALAVALVATAAACTEEQTASSPMSPDLAVVGVQSDHVDGFEVYNQNMFLGGDTGPLFTFDFGDPEQLPQIIAATGAFYTEVQASNIPERAAAVVDEIEARQPHVVGLSEAMGFFEGTLSLADFSFNATAAGPDLFVSVLTEIAARGLPYSVVAMQPTTSIALPIGPPNAVFEAPAIAVQDRVVMLRRDDVVPTATDQGVYIARLPLGPADIIRGWVSMTVDMDGTPYHFVATQLEQQGSADPSSGVPYFIRQVHNGQAQQLQAMLLGNDGVTVLMGDLNSDAEAEPTAPSYTDTYGNLVDAGFVDVWARAPHSQQNVGYTCCVVDGDNPRTPDERIDFFLVRSATPPQDNGLHRGFFRMEIVGVDDADRTPSGLWPSDHGGISASIVAPGNIW